MLTTEREDGEGCPRCAAGVLEVYRALEVGHIFQLGARYSAALGATVLLADGSLETQHDDRVCD